MAIILPLNKKNLKNEKEFKRYMIEVLKGTKSFLGIFEIETEETVLGFPDVLAITNENKAALYEFKYSNKQGVIKFQPTQPAFYKANKELDIEIIALDIRFNNYHIIQACELFTEKGRYKISDNGKVKLPVSNFIKSVEG